MTESLIVYCEKPPIGNPELAGPWGGALLDMRDPKDIAELENASSGSDERSLLLLQATYAKRGQFREGSWYSLPIQELKLEFEPLVVTADSPFLLRGYLRTARSIRASDYRVDPIRVVETLSADARLPHSEHGALGVRVADCGQGNWNEVEHPDFRIIYDTGASWVWSKSQLRQFLDKRQLETGPENYIIISHWDVDHYHALLAATPSELSTLKAVFAPDSIPGTATARRFVTLLRDHRVPMTLIPPSRCRSWEGRSINLHLEDQNEWMSLFRATPGASRNQTGIVLFVRGQFWSAVLTGDHHHSKVHKALRDYGKPCANLLYVVPHHGGRAGFFDRADWNELARNLQAVVSYGRDNPYGHPLAENVDQIESVSTTQLHRTPLHGDFVMTL